jgi:hypothetical protein
VKGPECLETAATLEQFGGSKARGLAAFLAFAGEGMAANYEPRKAVRNQLVLGSEAFAR